MTIRRTLLRSALTAAAAAMLALPPAGFAASHREAPITALDQKADITDWFAFVSPENPSRVVLILNIDPFLEPSNGPNYFPFDPGILYEMKIDNNHDGIPDITFQFRFTTQYTNPGVFTGYVGGLLGIPPITSLTGPGAAGLNTIQTYEVNMITPYSFQNLNQGQTLYAVPTNVGPRTMPNYTALRQQGLYTLSNGIRVFAGTVADPFFVDLGAAFDSLNFRTSAGGGVLSAAVDADDTHNYAPNALAGFNVNTIALEVPITMLTSGGQAYPASDKRAVIGTWGTTSRQNIKVLPWAVRSARRVRASPAAWQSADQRADYRHGFEGPLQHGRPHQRRSVLQLLPQSAAGDHLFEHRHPRAAGAAHRSAAAGSIHGADLPGLRPVR